MSRKSRRRLSPEEEKLWEKVAGTTTPLHAAKSGLPFAKEKAASPEPKRPAYVPPPFRVGQNASTETAIPAQKAMVQMDRKAFMKMKRGKTNPDARIDLHGMTAATAHTALTAFLLNAHAAQKRLVLVITGKGRLTEQGHAGVLRRQVPLWLEQPPLRSIVLQTAEAHQRHGGSGALYVYLRR